MAGDDDKGKTEDSKFMKALNELENTIEDVFAEESYEKFYEENPSPDLREHFLEERLRVISDIIPVIKEAILHDNLPLEDEKEVSKIVVKARDILDELKTQFNYVEDGKRWDDITKQFEDGLAEKFEDNLDSEHFFELADDFYFLHTLENSNFSTTDSAFRVIKALKIRMKIILYLITQSLHNYTFRTNIDSKKLWEQVGKSFQSVKTHDDFGTALISNMDALLNFDYPMLENESDELNDLIQSVAGEMNKFANTIRKLPIGSGPYNPMLSDVNSHIPHDVNQPRATYDALGMWPYETRDHWQSLEEVDYINWVGVEQENHIIDSPKFIHKILYRDFLDYIQSIGYDHKKVTGYKNNRRKRPALSTFDWGGEKRKYRPDVSIFYYHPNCPIAGREMRIIFESYLGQQNARITCIVGVDLFHGGELTANKNEQDEEIEKRQKTEDFLFKLFENFEEYQKTSGLLKNHKFNAECEELKLRGRTFDDIVMSDSKKLVLNENIFAILQNSDRLIERGVETNRGIMLAGPPGVGKSHTIDAIISRSECTVIYATYFMLSKAMDFVFELARKYSPTILILEDIDALGITTQRSEYKSGSGLSTLLNYMDGIESNNGVITIATSNHPELMDWALVARPGRFDVRVDYPYPDRETLQGILELKLVGFQTDDDIDMKSLVSKMPKGFTGSHIHDIVNQANYISVNASDLPANEIKITQHALESAVERSIYNFNKFLMERPGITLGSDITSKEVLGHNTGNSHTDYFG